MGSNEKLQKNPTLYFTIMDTESITAEVIGNTIAFDFDSCILAELGSCSVFFAKNILFLYLHCWKIVLGRDPGPRN